MTMPTKKNAILGRLSARTFLYAQCISVLFCSLKVDSSPLTTLDYRIVGTQLHVSPASVAVPKNIAGSVLVELTGGTNGAAAAGLAQGAYVEAVLRGPGLPEPRRIVAPVNTALLFPPLQLVGDYQLDNIRLVDAVTGATRMEGSPSSVPVRVFDEVLVSRVTSRPLTLDEIQEKGIVIDEQNFRAVEFEVGFVLNGQTIPIKFPVVAPTFKQSTEIIPAAELEEKLAEAAAINRQIASEIVELPPEFETAGLNIQVTGINFQRVDEGEDDGGLALAIPPIPALMVVPGNIGFLNQFFSVQIFTENAAPNGSGLSVKNIQAALKLPAGPDRIPAPDYEHPGDDPLRFARVGPDKIIQPIQSIVRPGVDGEVGTADDVARLFPGESGQAEFLVEGLQEGLHVMDLDLTADLDGLAAGTVKIKGKAAGSVLVRNPRFSLAFSHPRTIRAGEPYTATVTVLNTGITPANLTQVTLNRNAISGGVLESDETVPLGTLLPGQSATATFRVRAQRTGAISFSNLTTSDDRTEGRFRLSMGIDARGVALSPDTLALPGFINELPDELVNAANRMLGQALSAATAAQLPAGVLRISKSIVTRRAIELAEAGQRVRYGDPLYRVLPDLLRDWQGGREANAGFDQILRDTEAGREWREAIFAAMESTDALDATARLENRAADLAGLGQAFVLASGSDGTLTVEFGDGKAGATPDSSSEPFTAVYRGTNGQWAVAPPQTNAMFVWRFTNGAPNAELAALLVEANGTARQLRWSLTNLAAGSVYRFALNDGTDSLRGDTNDDGQPDTALSAATTTITEQPPALIAVEQDLTVNGGRTLFPCIGPPWLNYGTVVAVVFSKPVTQSSAGNAASYLLDNGNGAYSVTVQPSGRVALLNLRQGLSAIRPRTLTLFGVTDTRGNVLTNGLQAVRSVFPGTSAPFKGGVAIRGRVVRGDGSFARNVPVTLTMYDKRMSVDECIDVARRVSQVFTDEQGNFTFDFVMSGIPYSISATDTSDLTAEAVQLILASAAGDEFNRQKLTELANSASARSSLLEAFAVGAMPQAIAKAEGLDRAVVRDLVALGSGREGQEVPIALRFRGRATLTGQVVTADGVTPVPGAAVNLFPDPDSRELGRGLFADSNGRFAFFGVPLGVFTVDVQTSDRRFRTVAGLLEVPGATSNLVVVLPDLPGERTSLVGRVFESDNVTPHGGARVFIGKYDPRGNKASDIVAAVNADADGFWSAPNVPRQTYDVIAVSFDGRRKGVRLKVATAPDQAAYVSVTLEDITRVYGRVQFDDGRPAINALVSGGEMLVRTDTNGFFELSGVPIGRRTFSAGLQRNPAAGIDFPRLGSTIFDIVSGANNFVPIRLRPAGRIFGRVLDAAGQPVPGAKVAIPQDNGFFWAQADGAGNYVFENLPLDAYTLSAPAPAAAETDTGGLIEKIKSGNEDEILAAIGEAFEIFTGANDPFLTGETFNPITWGFTKTEIRFDGESAFADIRFLREGTIAGKIINHQNVPIGARVRLTGIGPKANGDVGFIIRGERNSDPALGTFEFRGEALVGPWGIQAASPFYPVVLTTNGLTTFFDPNVTNIVLRFPPVTEVNGRIAGNVFYPDDSPAGGGVVVKISFGNDYQIVTDTNGFFDTQIGLPAVTASGESISYRLEASDASTGLKGIASVRMRPGITNRVDIRLLAKDAGIQVVVRRADGSPASGAAVNLTQGSYPGDRYQGLANTNGQILFANLFEGSYAVQAEFTEGATKVGGRGGTRVGPAQTNTVTLQLAGTGTIEGTFVKRDLVTRIPFAQIAIGNLGFATTDTNGFFRFEGVPPGTHRLVSSDPVTGAGAQLTVSLNAAGQVRVVQLVETARGEVNGVVLNSYGNGVVVGAAVTLEDSDGTTPKRTVTTGPDGRFSFPGTPAGNFMLRATEPIGKRTGTRSGNLPEDVASVTADIQIQQLAILPVLVVDSTGSNPVQNAKVRIYKKLSFSSVIDLNATTDASGRANFVDLPLTTGYRLWAFSPVPPGDRNGMLLTNLSLTLVGTNPVALLTMPGVGAVSGTVLAADGATLAVNVDVDLISAAPLFDLEGGIELTTATDALGHFSFINVPLGDYRVVASQLALAARTNGILGAAGQQDVLLLRLGDNGTVSGRLVRADGVTPVLNVDVLVQYQSQSANPGRAVVRSGADGRFTHFNIPIGPFNLSAAAAEFGGLVNVNLSLNVNGQTLDLGDLPLDEANPVVVQVTPPDTATEVPITTTVELLMSEALATNSISTNGIFIRSVAGNVAAAVQLLPDTNGVSRVLRLTPSAPLVSERTYEVIVISGDLLNATGTLIGRGPTDLVGRSLPVPFVSRFTTADNDPPVLVSLFPSNNAVQIDPRAVPRLTFNEPIRAMGFVFSVTGPAGTVAGEASVGVNGQVLSFVPAVELDPNTVYSLRVSNVFDLPGNRGANEPFTASFMTLDTVGPTIASLAIVNNQTPVAGAAIQVQATLAAVEPNVAVRFTRDFVPIGTDSFPPFRAAVTLPESGSTTVRAIATDQFGNDGPFAELVIAVVSNQPPVISFVRLSPPAGPLTNNQPFSLQVGATDDLSVTNVTVVGLGGLTFATNFNNGALRTLNLIVPGEAVPGSLLQFRAQARDGLGVKSAELVIDMELRDGSAPNVTILSPAANSVVNPAQPLDLVIASADNSASHFLEVVLSGAVTATQTLAVVSAPNASVTNVFVFSLAGAPTDGAVITATVRATDDATNRSTATRNFVLPDTRPPQLVSFSPTNGAVRQSLWPAALIFDFDEALRSATITNSVFVTNNTGHAATFTVSLTNLNRQLRVILARPLLPGVTYTNLLLPTLTDTSSNGWQNVGGAPVPSEGAAFTFTTAAVFDSLPTNGTRAIAGQSISVRANYEAGLGASFFRFQLNTNAPVQVSAGATSAVALITIPTNATEGIISISASPVSAFTEPYSFAPVTLDVSPLAGDADGDGMPNTYELANGFDPFVNDAGSDPDNDGLTNLAEFNAGTNPRNPDTDGDGSPDGVDPNPLVPSDATNPVELTFDIAGIANFQNVNQNYGDRVTTNIMGGFSYGGLNPFAPNISASYGTLDPALWTAGYGTLTNVLFEDQDNTGVLTVTLAADFGVKANLHRFDLGAFASAFSSDPLISSVQVLDAVGNVLFATNNAAVSRTTFTRFEFVPALTAGQLTIRVDARNLGSLNDGIAMDNIRYSQSGEVLCLPPPSGQVASWRGEGNAQDGVSTNHGVLQNGVTFAPGFVGQAFRFDGTDDFVVVPAAGVVGVTNDFTMEMWAFPTASRGITSESTGGTAGLGSGQRFAVFPTHGDAFSVGHAGAGVSIGTNGVSVFEHASFYIPSPLVYDTPVIGWTHVAVVYVNNRPSLYLNGQLVRTGLQSTKTVHPSMEQGGDPYGYYAGLLDEYTIYSRALSQPEIASIYSSGSAGKCAVGNNPDTDGDGLPDLFEFTHHFEPRVNDAGQDPDGDSLTNLAEFQRGTLPRDSDTDNDNLSDGQEVALGTNPLNPDTDGDGLRDDVDPNPLVAGTGIAFVAPATITVLEGAQTNLTMQAVSDSAAMSVLGFSPTNPAPLFASLGTPTFVNTATNGTASAQLQLSPLFDEAGTYVLTLRAAAANGDSGVFDLTVIVEDNPALMVTRWRNPVSGNWNDPARWDNGLPDSSKLAVIDVDGTYTVTLNTSATVPGLVLGAGTGTQTLVNNSFTLTLNGSSAIRSNGVLNLGGTLSGSGLLAVGGMLNWTDGTMSGSGTTAIGPGGRLNLSSGNTKSLSRTLRNEGLVDWAGGQINFNTGTFNNQSNGVFVANVAATIAWNGGSPVFNNAGLFVKTNAGTVTFSSVAFNNSGGVQFTQGTLTLGGGGSNSQHIEVPGGAVLSHTAGYQHAAGSRLFGAGNASFTGGTSTVAGGYEITGLTTISATLNVNSDVTVPLLNLSGTLGGSGTVTVTGVLNWTDGVMSGSGTTAIRPGGVMNLSSSNAKNLNRTLNNLGLADWTGGQINFGSTFNNQSNGVFVANVAATIAWNGGSPVFNNAGTFVKTNTGTVTFSSVAFNNSGVVELGAGAITMNSAATHSGSYNLGAGTALNFTGGTHTYAGSLIFNGEGALNWSGNVTISVAADLVIAQTINFNNGTLNGAGNLAVEGVLNWADGTMSAGAVTAVSPGGRLVISGANIKVLNRTLRNEGLVEWIGGQINFGGSTFNNQSNGVFVANVAGTLAASGGSPVFNNAGLFVKTNAGTVTIRGIAFNNSGGVALGAGAITMNSTATHSGSYNLGAGTALNFTGGTHTYAGSLIFNGEGALNWSGNITISVAADLVIAQTINFNNGTLSGAGNLAVEGVLNWADGTMSAGGITAVSPGGRLVISGANIKVLNRTLRNEGLVEWTGGQINFGGSTFNNQSNGVFVANVAGTLAASGGSPVFNNAGTFVKTNTGTVTISGIAFNNSGGVALGAGAITMNSAATHSGSYNLGAGTALNFTGGTHTFNVGSAFSGTGTVQVQTPIVLATSLNFGTLEVVFLGSATVSGNFLIANTSGGIINVNKTMTFPGSITIGGTLTVGGATSTVTINGTLTLDAAGVLNNPGTVRVAQFVNNGGTINGNPPVLLAPSPSPVVVQIQVMNVPGDGTGPGDVQATGSGRLVTLKWRATPGDQFIIESSANLQQWTNLPAVITGANSGEFEAIISAVDGNARFYRLRRY